MPERIKVGKLYRVLTTKVTGGFAFSVGDVVLVVKAEYESEWDQDPRGTVIFLTPDGEVTKKISFDQPGFDAHFELAKQ